MPSGSLYSSLVSTFRLILCSAEIKTPEGLSIHICNSTIFTCVLSG
ncbi:hypothetical protein PgNI_06150 [Pyricularia grisea]|uniref:Uncharacterized protein n=1 Tax=Pyricularia grisea TaxID=148305 RepID=A0A6P8B7P2_PYRGI|nr:hypothetical protein PgNI_06150 [Pyricularia grisea]TLD11295.1 hypothetical protein PgNI_06150 [Pyricularia grisea]